MNVAIVQAHLEWENVPVNLKLFNKRIAAIEGANIIVLPEMFASGFTMKGKERVAPFYGIDRLFRRRALLQPFVGGFSGW